MEGEVPLEEAYSNEERGLALKALANEILRVRDGETSGFRQDSVLKRLAEDLMYAVATSGRGPDAALNAKSSRISFGGKRCVY